MTREQYVKEREELLSVIAAKLRDLDLVERRIVDFCNRAFHWVNNAQSQAEGRVGLEHGLDFVIATDASFNQATNECGWGAVFESKDRMFTLFGYRAGIGDTSEAELYAVVQALKALPDKCSVLIRTDSQYILHVDNRIAEMAAKKFMATKRRIMKQMTLLQSYWVLKQRHAISIHKVRGHHGDATNERAHNAARVALLKKKSSILAP